MASSRRYSGEFYGSYEINVITATDEIIRVMVKDSDTFSQIQHKIHGKKQSSSPTPMNVLIKNLEGRIMYYLEVKPSDTIGNLKAKMCAFTHVLLFNDAVLEDNRTLADFRIVNGSSLTLIDNSQAKMEIYVHTLTNKAITLLVAPMDTIAYVKLCIMCKELVHVDEQVLIFNGMALEDSGTIFDFYIREKSTLTLVRRLRGLMEIFVKTFEGKVIPVKVRPSNTISDVKFKIQGEVDIPHDEQELIFDETVLYNMDTISECNIYEKSTLNLVRLSKGYMRISIETQPGRAMTLEVKPSDTVDNVKSKYMNMKGISGYPCSLRFIFEGRQLMDDSTLADCAINNNSTIHCMFLTKGN